MHARFVHRSSDGADPLQKVSFSPWRRQLSRCCGSILRCFGSLKKLTQSRWSSTAVLSLTPRSMVLGEFFALMRRRRF